MLKCEHLELNVLQQQANKPKKNKKSLEQKKNILDVAQRICCLIISIIVLAVMAHAYIVFRNNQDVTHDGIRIYPTFMQLWFVIPICHFPTLPFHDALKRAKA
jgi:hypothetical protein